MLRLILPLLLIAFSGFTEGVQFRNQFGEVRGNLRLEVITFPEKIAENFVRLNPQAIFYRPVKAEKKRNPLVIFLHGSGGSRRSIERSKWTSDVKRFNASKEGNRNVNILVPQSKGQWDPKSLNVMLDHVLEKNPAIDTNRIYCVGYSMGERALGNGLWLRQSALLLSFPKLSSLIFQASKVWLSCRFGQWLEQRIQGPGFRESKLWKKRLSNSVQPW